jgi:glutaredoxin
MDQREVVLYTRSRSLRCWRAQRFLRGRGYHFKVIDTTNDPEARAWLLGLTQRKALLMPYVFVDGRLVGEFSVIKALECSGTLVRLVRGNL